jgi:hypothetical protein
MAASSHSTRRGKVAAPAQVVELVERFQHNRVAYHASHYNETQLRHEFLDPFFEALGWDINNRQGYAEAYNSLSENAP